ncbi:MAG: acyltransferase [Actinobacteria bacterium]|nr:acyltransferase [Actinomycetota bacterium]
MGSVARMLVTRAYDVLAGYRDPVQFARGLGVQVGEGVKFYGVSRGMFGSEPWMVSLGDRVYVTSGVLFVTHDGGTLVLRHEEPTLEWTAPISVGNDVYIGVRSIIMPGVSIGDRVIIGANSVITKSVPNDCVVAGVPGRVVRNYSEYRDAMNEKSLNCGHLTGDDKAQVIARMYGKSIPPNFGRPRIRDLMRALRQ